MPIITPLKNNELKNNEFTHSETDEQERADTDESNEENKELKKKIKKLLSCLNDTRFKYQYWLNVGFIIYNETKNIKIWKKWSKNYKKYDEDEINNKWLTMKDNKNNKLGIGTLIMYAKEDNEPLYNELFKNKY